MTAKEETFARAVAEGRTLRDAYRGAYDMSRMKEGTVDRKAQEVLHKPHVAAYVARLEDEVVQLSVEKGLLPFEAWQQWQMEKLAAEKQKRTFRRRRR